MPPFRASPTGGEVGPASEGQGDHWAQQVLVIGPRVAAVERVVTEVSGVSVGEWVKCPHAIVSMETKELLSKLVHIQHVEQVPAIPSILVINWVIWSLTIGGHCF